MAASNWAVGAPGVLVLPSGRALRGRALRKPVPSGPAPDFGLYLLGHAPPPTAWASAWLRWPDFWLPTDRAAAVDAIRAVYARADVERVEVACGGGVGRTGTVLAGCAVLDGLSPDDAVRYVRQHHHRRAVETPWQRAFLRRLASAT